MLPKMVWMTIGEAVTIFHSVLNYFLESQETMAGNINCFFIIEILSFFFYQKI